MVNNSKYQMVNLSLEWCPHKANESDSDSEQPQGRAERKEEGKRRERGKGQAYKLRQASRQGQLVEPERTNAGTRAGTMHREAVANNCN